MERLPTARHVRDSFPSFQDSQLRPSRIEPYSNCIFISIRNVVLSHYFEIVFVQQWITGTEEELWSYGSSLRVCEDKGEWRRKVIEDVLRGVERKS